MPSIYVLFSLISWFPSRFSKMETKFIFLYKVGTLCLSHKGHIFSLYLVNLYADISYKSWGKLRERRSKS